MASFVKGLALIGVLAVGLVLIKHLTKDAPPSPFSIELAAFMSIHGKSIAYIAIVIFLVLWLIQIAGLNMTPEENSELEQVVTIEKMSNLDRSKGFCKNNEGNASVLEKKCNNLSKLNCNTVNCCVHLNGTKCVAGDSSGPTFTSDDNGKDINIDTYYFRNKCHGKKC